MDRNLLIPTLMANDDPQAQSGPACVFMVWELGMDFTFLKGWTGTSLVAQWLRILLPMQGTRVWALVPEDPTCCRATRPVCHNYWACALDPVLSSLCSATREATAVGSTRTATKSSPRSPQLGKACAQQRRHNAAKNKLIFSKKGWTK